MFLSLCHERIMRVGMLFIFFLARPNSRMSLAHNTNQDPELCAKSGNFSYCVACIVKQTKRTLVSSCNYVGIILWTLLVWTDRNICRGPTKRSTFGSLCLTGLKTLHAVTASPAPSLVCTRSLPDRTTNEANCLPHMPRNLFHLLKIIQLTIFEHSSFFE